MKKEYSAGIILYYKRNDSVHYLLLHYERGHWDFPKGHLEAHEAQEQAALRELYEETKLKTTLIPGFQESCTYFFTDPVTKDLVKKVVHFFIGRSYRKHVALSAEHKGYVWLPLDKALERLTYDNAKDMLTKANAFIEVIESEQ